MTRPMKDYWIATSHHIILETLDETECSLLQSLQNFAEFELRCADGNLFNHVTFNLLAEALLWQRRISSEISCRWLSIDLDSG